MSLFKKKSRVIAKKPVLLITDIGADVDDTVALLTLIGSERLRLVAAVTTGGKGEERTSLIRGWLSILGQRKNGIEVSASYGPGMGHCYVPKDLPTVLTKDKTDATELILRTSKTYGSSLRVFVIGAMTPLADALKNDSEGYLRKIGGIFVQGNILYRAGRIRPDAKAFNFREDMKSAHIVFDKLQDTVPFTSLGKFAAYVVGITTKDFRSFSRPGLPSMTEMVRRQMGLFISSGPERFWSLYPVPEQYRDEGWFDHLPNDICCHPYDPLLVLCLHDIQLFDPVYIPAKSGLHVHTTVGNSPDHNGIRDKTLIRNKLVSLVNRACDLSLSGGSSSCSMRTLS